MNPRSKLSQILYFEGQSEKLVDHQDFLNKYNINGLIRLSLEEHRAASTKDSFYHFNYQRSGHKVGHKYALPLIISHGSLSEQGEILPLLYFKRCKVAKCVSVQENVSYDDIPQEIFNHSLFSDKANKEWLQDYTYQKYKPIIPSLTLEKVKDVGVGITKLKIIGDLK